MRVRTYQADDQSAVIALWQRCGLVRPTNDPAADIVRKLHTAPDLLLVGDQNEVVVATVMAGYDGHRGWINYLAVAPGVQRQGWGRLMMVEAETRLRARGCPKINLQVRAENAGVLQFYRQLGFSVDDVVSLGKRLVNDATPRWSPARTRSTPLPSDLPPG